jgi:Ca2+-binding RTX toxin-like protein
VGNSAGKTLFFRNTGDAENPIFAAPKSNPFGIKDVGTFATPILGDIDGDGDLDAFVGNDAGFYRNDAFAPGVSIEPKEGKRAVTEGGATDTYTVVLNSKPVANVTINLDTTNKQVTSGANSLTFTPDNWNVAQTVTITAINDTVGEGKHTGVIKHTVTSTDGNYNGIAIDNVTVAITDNDLPLHDPVFNIPASNPFGLTNAGSFANPTFVDIDSDGDLDAFIGNNAGDTLFYRNTGTTISPSFAAPVTNLLGSTNVEDRDGASPAFVDIDGDGDLDAFVGYSDGDLLFYRNTGTASSPAFIVETNNFGLIDVGSNASPTFADIDGDGDQDAFVGNREGNVLIYGNIGTASSPVFAKYFELTDVGSYAKPTFADLDGDGDLDASVGNRDGDTLFLRNTGSASSPTFADPDTNPFGLTNVNYFGLTDVNYNAAPTFADIDGDGNLDAFVGGSDGNILFFLAPKVTNLNQSIDYSEDTTTAIADIMITYPEADTFTATVTLAGGNSSIGSFTANSGNGESYSAETGVWAVTGTKTAVNAALAAMSFVPVANSFADTTAIVSISDGVSPAITGTLIFNGEPVNDAPQLTKLKAITYTDTVFDDTFTTIKGALVASDIDSNGLTYGIAGGIDIGFGKIIKSIAYGELMVTKATGEYSFVPDDAAIESLNFDVSKEFTVTVSDGLMTKSKPLTINIVQNGTTESKHDDTLTGTSGNDKFDGLAGKDIISGLEGDDTLDGGAGNDVLTGGSGKDIFKLTNFSKDTIIDFSVDDDTIQLENSAFTQLTATGVLKATNFKIGAAVDANDYVIYNNGTGELFYDADGSGAGAAVQIAVLGISIALTNADFVVI